jgi:hypothetical protein
MFDVPGNERYKFAVGYWNGPVSVDTIDYVILAASHMQDRGEKTEEIDSGTFEGRLRASGKKYRLGNIFGDFYEAELEVEGGKGTVGFVLAERRSYSAN